MKNFITIFLILTSGNLIAQNSESTSSETIYTFVDQPPEFKGGIDAISNLTGMVKATDTGLSF